MRTLNFPLIAIISWLLSSCSTTGPPAVDNPPQYGPITQAVAETKQGDVKVTLMESDCQLKNEITNLKYRAAWEEKGKVFEGCWTVFYGGLVVMYFNDKTLAAAPLAWFKKLPKQI